MSPKSSGNIIWKPKLELSLVYEGFVGKNKVFSIRCQVLKYHLSVKDKNLITQEPDQRMATSFDLFKLFEQAEQRIKKYI